MVFVLQCVQRSEEMLSQMIILFVITAAIHRCTGESAFVCTEENTGKQNVELRCPFGTRIQIKESLYGRNKWRQCLYTVGDCTEEADLSEECCGRRNCSVTVWRIYSIKCEYVTFFRVIYECVPAGEAECEHEVDKDQFDLDLIDITSQMKFSSTSTKTQPIKSTAHDQMTSHNHVPETDITDPGSSAAISTTVESDETSYDLTVIILSAVAIAILLVCIIVVALCLRKFKWQGEKECIFNLFAGWCKRHPPDGCENPETEHHVSPRNVHCSTKGNDVNEQNMENTKKLKMAAPVSQTESHDVNHNNDCSETSSIDKCGGHHYVVFEDIKARPNHGNPVLRSMTEGRVVLDQKAYNTTPVVSEGLGTTAV